MNVVKPPKDGLVRALPGLSYRAAEDTEPDADDMPMPTLYGHFLRFNEPTEIDSYYEGTFIEEIAPGACAKTFREGRDTIKSLFQHGMDFMVGDKPLGGYDRLEEDSEGAYYEVPMLDTLYCRELVPGLAAGLYGASFCFRVIREDFNEEPDPTDSNPKGMPVRVLREIQVFEGGPVTFPAYAGATAGLRSMTDELLADQLRRDQSQLEQVLERAAHPQQLAEMFERRGIRALSRLPKLTRAATPPPVTVTITGDADTLTEKIQAFTDRAAATLARSEDRTPVDTDDQGAISAEDAEDAPQTAEPETAPRNTDTADSEAAVEQDTAPPEGADRNGHPHDAGRRDTNHHEKKERAMNKAELEARQESIRSRIVEIGEQHGDDELPSEIQTEYEGLISERSENETKITGIEARQAEVRRVAEAAPTTTVVGETESGDGAGAGSLHVPGASRSTDPYDVEEIFSRARAATSLETRSAIMRDAALRAVEEEKVLFHDRVDVARAKEHMEWLLRREARIGDIRSEVAERILHTGSELYQRAFVKQVQGGALAPEEQRALATFTGSAGGFAVPYQLDPTLIPSSNASVNPFRAIARSVTTLSNEWKGVTSGAITAAYAAEGTEASDNTPTLAQPVANPERAQAFVPFSYELEGDWTEALTEMSGLIAEAKDDLEAIKFLEGAGHGSNEPEGLLTGATTVVKAGGTAAFAVADLYALEAALPPRFRSKAQFMANRAIFNKIRQFDTAGGAALWVWLREGLGNNGPTPGNIEAKLAGYPVNEVSSMKEVLTTGTKILTIGDFSKFLILDRVGMDIQVIPNLFGASGRPTGQRGLYAIWRNTSKVLVKTAFRTLETS